VKARRVKGLDPAASLADNAERIVRTRLDELYSFTPKVLNPKQVKALHDMRIAAKLNKNAGIRLVSQVGRHDRDRATEECEGGHRHAAVLQGQKLGKAPGGCT